MDVSIGSLQYAGIHELIIECDLATTIDAWHYGDAVKQDSSDDD